MRMLRLLVAIAVMALSASPVAAQVYTRIPTNQVSVGTTATLVAAAHPDRIRITVTITAANNCAIGGPGITLTTGFPLAPIAYTSITLLTNNDIYVVCSATTPVGWLAETR